MHIKVLDDLGYQNVLHIFNWIWPLNDFQYQIVLTK